MKTLSCKYPNQTPDGSYHAIVFDGLERIEAATSNCFTLAADLAMEEHPDALLDDDAKEQILMEGMMG